MESLTLGDGRDCLICQIESEPSVRLKVVAVGLEPVRPATARQPSVGHHDVRTVARGSERTLGDARAAAGHQHIPGAAASFDRELDRWRTVGLEPLLRRWRAAAHREGTPLAVHEPGGAVISGRYAGLTPDGSLLLRLEDGTTRPIHAGDVSLA